MVICSSIVLLQERFKQLERVKEMRQKKELLKLLSHSYDQYHPSITMQMHNIDNDHHHQSVLNNNYKLFSPQNPELSSQLSLCLWPQLHSRTLDKSRVSNTTSLTKIEFDGLHLDVDTSLHL
ncbi:hypothetical protein K7X08_028696 [Anisodus acutangulus]|uniref:Uncharacterized protein n=1 Tax=Anisodus acutangulus TaxID=402998 RepID=A0A9Q1QTF5_9SOLA|nr:hypothetical protein K7X08_028696 [Anisodus acutangulus]